MHRALSGVSQSHVSHTERTAHSSWRPSTVTTLIQPLALIPPPINCLLPLHLLSSHSHDTRVHKYMTQHSPSFLTTALSFISLTHPPSFTPRVNSAFPSAAASYLLAVASRLIATAPAIKRTP